MIVHQNLTKAQAEEIVKGVHDQFGKDLPVQKSQEASGKWKVAYLPPGRAQVSDS